MEPPPLSAPPPQNVSPRKGGCAIGAVGCTGMFASAIICLGLLFGGLWWVCVKFINEYTAAQGITLQAETPGDEHYDTASGRLNSISEAARNHQSVRMEFTATELNALIARHPDFSDMRGKFHVAMADSAITLDMSVPLTFIELPKIRDRWFNGTARFGFIYQDDSFAFAVKSLGANGNELPISFINGFGSSFSRSFNEGFAKARRENPRSNEFWQNVKTLAVMGDKLVVTTRGAGTRDAGRQSTKGEQIPEPTTSPNKE